MLRLAVLALALGCGSSQPALTTPPPTPPTPVVEGDPSCPLLVAGTSLAVEDTPEGPALVFVTTGDVAQVRTRGQALAAMHNDRNGPSSALGMMFSAKSTATASDIDGGVRVVFAPSDPASAGAVGDELRMHAGHLAGASSCEMGH